DYIKDGVPTVDDRAQAGFASSIVYRNPEDGKLYAYVDDGREHLLLKYKGIEIRPEWIYGWLEDEKLPNTMTPWESVKKKFPREHLDLNRRLNLHYLGDIIGEEYRYQSKCKGIATCQSKGMVTSNVGIEKNGEKKAVYVRIGYFDELMRLIGGKGKYSDVVKLAVRMSEGLKQPTSSPLYIEAEKAIESVFNGNKTAEQVISDFDKFIEKHPPHQIEQGTNGSMPFFIKNSDLSIYPEVIDSSDEREVKINIIDKKRENSEKLTIKEPVEESNILNETKKSSEKLGKYSEHITVYFSILAFVSTPFLVPFLYKKYKKKLRKFETE
ncbi:MAG: hypothetical protein AAF335_02025, partial [Bacteroidota bacterium]